MNEEKYFLEAINAGEPNADLIYADWLEEQGRPEADEIRNPTVVVLTNCNFSNFIRPSLSSSRSGHILWSWSGYRSASYSKSRRKCRIRSWSRPRSGGFSRSG